MIDKQAEECPTLVFIPSNDNDTDGNSLTVTQIIEKHGDCLTNEDLQRLFEAAEKSNPKYKELQNLISVSIDKKLIDYLDELGKEKD